MLKCKTCVNKNSIPGDNHISCGRPSVSVAGVSQHGLDNGWFMFPINFDPMWAENCTGYVSKDEILENLTKEEIEKIFIFEVLWLKKLMDTNFSHVSIFSKDKLVKNLEAAQNAIIANPPKEQTASELIKQINLLRKV